MTPIDMTRASAVLLFAMLGCAGSQGTASEPPPAPVAVVVPAAADGSDGGVEASAGNTPSALAELADSGLTAILGSVDGSAFGVMWGDSIGDSFAAGGLGLVGVDGDAGSVGGGVGLGSIGTIGHGSGFGTGSGLGRPHSPVQVTPGSAAVVGALDKDIIRRIVRRHFARLRYCYERQLASNPNLAGSVVVRFTIAASGDVVAVQDAGSTIGDTKVKECVFQTVRAMTFPKPKSGIVIVTYPFQFIASAPDSDAGAVADSGTD